MAATDVGSMSVTATWAVGCIFSSARDSAPWPAPSSRIRGSGDPGIGHVSHLVERDARGLLVPTENPFAAVESADHSAFQIIDVVAVEVLQTIGLQPPVQPRRVRSAARHAVDVEDARHADGRRNYYFSRVNWLTSM
jgi:hypothetical protein